MNDRALCHIDNAYFLEHIEIVSHRCKTHTVSNTAFRGFGAPQAMVVIEHVVDDIARARGLDPLDVRRANFYGIGERNVTHYGQVIEDNVLPQLSEQLEGSSDYRARRRSIAEWNANNAVIKRGLALTPVKFGVSFTATAFNQAGALVHVYSDGTVLLNHGGTEMGQGVNTKVAQVVATELGLPLATIRITTTDTSKVPNTSATAASSGSDLNGMAAQAATRSIKDRLVAFACEAYGVQAGEIRFEDGLVHVGARTMKFAELTQAAYRARISLSSTGFYRTPKIHWNKATMSGRPFFYFAYGAAVAEVAVDTLTGESRLLQIDIVHDVGNSLNPAIDLGQIEGGFLQGAGWLTSEELWWNDKGELKTHAPSTYKIPTAYDWPARARVELLKSSPNREDTIYRSKAVGEPPLMLAISVLHAIRDACAACGPHGTLPQLTAPATRAEAGGQPESANHEWSRTCAVHRASVAPVRSTQHQWKLVAPALGRLAVCGLSRARVGARCRPCRCCRGARFDTARAGHVHARWARARAGHDRWRATSSGRPCSSRANLWVGAGCKVRGARSVWFWLRSSGQCCGGVVELWLERFTRADLPLLRSAAQVVKSGVPVLMASALSDGRINRRVVRAGHAGVSAAGAALRC